MPTGENLKHLNPERKLSLHARTPKPPNPACSLKKTLNPHTLKKTPIPACSQKKHPRNPKPCVLAEEKVDGANLGISMDPDRPGQLRFQKRGHWVNPASEAQYSKLSAWAAARHTDLVTLLGGWGGGGAGFGVLGLDFRV